MDKGLIGGSTVLMLLSLLQEKEYYGYEIIKEIEQRSNCIFQFKEGTLYPVLHRMESQGLVKSYKATAETGKERKYYQITVKGKTQLAKEKEQWNAFTISVKKVLGGAGYACP
ncbi:lineage-specific thermal regulator protein [Anaerotignum neopropionicum]|uniref:Lineage-specific thermal regulator protein n=1 Tax=Anaerotignum neopropionicum TaxID=36847 RepID=A0A136WCN5_9FIRM|nr:helix-turn-helix transcriptional regulator [Anaerotignum neopropionicum]KXL52278.1 lineage-specific thermal regulator protein [Anaerotignum neopropionicum]